MRISDWSSDVCSSDLDPDQGLDAFRTVEAEEFAGERKLVAFFEDAHGILDDLDVEGLADRYFDLLQKFTAKYSRSEEHTSELQSLMRISYAVFCLKKKNTKCQIKSTLQRCQQKIND